MTNVLLDIFLRMGTQVWNLQYIPFSLSLFLLFDVIEHLHENNSSLEVCWVAHFVHEFGLRGQAAT